MPTDIHPYLSEAHTPESRAEFGVDQPGAPILPGAWLGMLGGGQLGRMFTHAAQSMGYRVCVLDPDQDSPAGTVADRHICAPYTDEAALNEMAKLCQAVSTEFENVPSMSLDRLEQLGAFVAPRGYCVSIAQNRIGEKKFFASCAERTGVPTAPHWVIQHDADVDQVPEALLPGILKTARMGYDGKGQARVKTREDVRAAWRAMQHVPCVLEQMLPLAYEVSVLAARAADGSTATWPLAENVHRDGILFSTTMPSSSVSDDIANRARAAAAIIATEMGYVGVLCIEFFVLTDGSLVANEMAPRPHNSGHITMDACETSQFEQQVRAMARMPLGSTRQHSAGKMLNLLGDAWFEFGLERTPAWDQVIAQPGAKLHLYGKSDARPARKMGHVNCVGDDAAVADAAFVAAADALHIPL
ncbi:5-(carboxyamino)imidazole ribonucleotide synthase [Cupriavidus plantarum]|uniref:N5-carboxyaminoimidazole ribonucleotide synthase n=1 Tax=Cupriavidus plantarum TaxID=942865 RepID=A0A316F264_9BURK|nr:5-(carboxyamino)imidazole ribonucleotide synthase [Cupriavidus plantarum]NYH97967.1 5-(carboxyamino)imidazole ribonucleotide synthase [Cupriavidus plantarum]PWK38402.1 5-(carboxyamino)imidazole ribonucleotide synthase [Cupriavidus plantarum]REE92055.1 5-(carboxyamino)imidazole ribonucleotide synthase [Cupriavidus plantarum]RLK35602.1 5-(carboxyamino)imidazole ribonucleotide synthase [Cupriavidus plantarum]CAG2127404.1 N5-carboxyaminoimidazole ribonucleotide synthase [Cupriavidus plantarum]